MILTRKMDLCRVVGLVCLGSAAEGTGRRGLVTPPCQVRVVVVCFDTLAEESPQALSSKTCVLKQLGSEFGEGAFNSGHVPWPRIAWGTAYWRPDGLDSFCS